MDAKDLLSQITILFDEKFKQQELKLDEQFKQQELQFDEQFKQQESKFDEQFKEVSSKFGMLYEIQARREIERKYGERYSQQFMIESLYGLARSAFPKKKDITIPAQLKIHDESQIQAKYVTCLINFIFDQKLYYTVEQRTFSAIKYAIEDDESHKK